MLILASIKSLMFPSFALSMSSNSPLPLRDNASAMTFFLPNKWCTSKANSLMYASYLISGADGSRFIKQSLS